MSPEITIERRFINKKVKWNIYMMEHEHPLFLNSYRYVDDRPTLKDAYLRSKELLEIDGRGEAPIQVVFKDKTAYTIETDGDLMLAIIKAS